MRFAFPLIPARAGTQCFREATVPGMNINVNPVTRVAHRTGSRLSPG